MQQLTSIRGLLAILIALYHIKHYLAEHIKSEALIFLISKSYLSVDFFFVLSGFILTWKYSEKFKTIDRKDYINYIVNRASRIYPLHIFMMLTYTTIPILLLLTGRPVSIDGVYNLDLYVPYLLLIQNWFFDDNSAWNLPAWSISVELLFYIILPGYIFLLSKTNEHMKLMLTALLLIVLSYVSTKFYNGENLSDNYMSTSSIIRGASGFSAGVILHLLTQRQESNKILVTALILISIVFINKESIFIYPMCISIIYLILGFPEKISKALCKRPLIYLGEISFSIYLTHFFIRDLFTMIFLPSNQSAPIWWILLYIISVIFLSGLTYKFIEIPSKLSIRKILLRKSL